MAGIERERDVLFGEEIGDPGEKLCELRVGFLVRQEPGVICHQAEPDPRGQIGSGQNVRHLQILPAARWIGEEFPDRNSALPLPVRFYTIPRMSKKLLPAVGTLLVFLNIGMLFCPDPGAKTGVQIFSAAVGVLVIVLGSRSSKPVAAPAIGPSAAPAPSPPAPRPEAEIVAFLALLQENGRLVDFAREDIAGAADADLGAAARVVHDGCRKVLDEYFDIQPVHETAEGAQVVLEAGFDASAHRLLGSVSDHPPYRGRLLHPGWIARSVKLPRITGTTDGRPWPVVAPAEVEI